MSKAQLGVDASAASKISDAGSEFKLPAAAKADLLKLTKEEWIDKYGEIYANELKFTASDPNWAENPDSWWFHEVGRAGGSVPLWMQNHYQMPELDCPETGGRAAEPIDARPRSEWPMWAERMNLDGTTQGPQSSTIYGHRREYLPSQKTASRSMFERYQPNFQRVLNEELPDVSDPADGRFWKAGVAQGMTTDPYEKRLAISGRRKPIVVGPRSIAVIVDGESHTLANTVRDTAWLHPHVEFAGYSIEHPVYRHVNMRLQTSKPSGVSGEQALVETLDVMQNLYKHVGDAMTINVEQWPEKSKQLEAEKEAEAEEKRRSDVARDEKMQKWLKMVNKEIAFERELELELFGHVVSTELDKA